MPAYTHPPGPIELGARLESVFQQLCRANPRAQRAAYFDHGHWRPRLILDLKKALEVPVPSAVPHYPNMVPHLLPGLFSADELRGELCRLGLQPDMYNTSGFGDVDDMLHDILYCHRHNAGHDSEDE